MGNKSSYCTVHASAPSPLYYEQQSVVADPLDKYIDFNGLYFGIAALIRLGGTSRDDRNIKGERCLLEGEDGFLLEKTYDGKRMGMDQDLVMNHFFSYVSKRGIILEQVRVPPENWLREISVTIIHQPRLRVECWRQTMNVERGTGVEPTIMLQGMLTVALEDSSIACKPDQDSIIKPGMLSVLSEDLSSRTDFNGVWAGLMKVLKTQQHNIAKKFAELRECKGDAQVGGEYFEVACVMDADILTKFGMPCPEMADRTFVYKVTTNTELGVIVSEVVDEGLMNFYGVDYFVVHKEPLVVEHWKHAYGERQVGVMLQTVVNWSLSTVIAASKQASDQDGFVAALEALIKAGGPPPSGDEEAAAAASSGEKPGEAAAGKAS